LKFRFPKSYVVICGVPVQLAALAVLAPAAGPISLEAPGLSWGNNEIDRATAALRADKASSPFSDGEIGAVARGLFAGIDINMAPATVAPCAQQQTRLGRRAERRRP
jgi:hypothetical protein